MGKGNVMNKEFLAVQKELKNVPKSGWNPHFKSKFSTLTDVIDTVKDVCNKNGIAITQAHDRDEFGHFVATSLIYANDQVLTSKLYLELDKPTMQALGSAISYARRYSLLSMFCLATEDFEDDDANEATSDFEKQQSTFMGASNVRKGL
jgi:ERF superfamily protein